MEERKPPSQKLIELIDREWPALRKALHVIAAKNASPQDAEDVVSEAYKAIRSGSRPFEPDKDGDFAVFAGLVVLSVARNWRTQAWNRRRDKGAFDETAQRRVTTLRLSPEQMAIFKQGFERAFRQAFEQGCKEDRLFSLVKSGVTDPHKQAAALGISVGEVRSLVARIERVCENLMEKQKESES